MIPQNTGTCIRFEVIDQSAMLQGLLLIVITTSTSRSLLIV